MEVPYPPYRRHPLLLLSLFVAQTGAWCECWSSPAAAPTLALALTGDYGCCWGSLHVDSDQEGGNCIAVLSAVTLWGMEAKHPVIQSVGERSDQLLMVGAGLLLTVRGQLA